MTNPLSKHLRLHVAEEIREQGRPAQGLEALLAELRAPFASATGWNLDLLPASTAARASDAAADKIGASKADTTIAIPGIQSGKAAGHLRIEPQRDAAQAVPVAAAMQLAAAVADIAGRLLISQDALWKREAELAAGVPVTLQGEAEAHLAVRLQSVLRGAADAVGCQAAGLYLLDADTSELKLRSCWGLSHQRLTEPARPLRGAIADLEALLGHAVVLDDLLRFPHWNAPENYAAAVCVPVSTPTVPLGTLWIFSDRARDFSPRETNVLEMAAGRLAADLEREMLLTEGLEGHRLKRQLSSAERMQRTQLPRIAPLVDGWEVVGRCDQRDQLGGDFYDWFPLAKGPQWGIALGDAHGGGVEAALVAATVRGALRAHARSSQDPGRMLAGVNRTLWGGSAGDQAAALACLAIEPNTGHVRAATAGTLTLLAITPDGAWRSLGRPTLPLGREPLEPYRAAQLELAPGDVLIAFTEGYRDTRDSQGAVLGDTPLVEAVFPYLSGPIDQIADAVRAPFDRHGTTHDDRSLVILRRRAVEPRT